MKLRLLGPAALLFATSACFATRNDVRILQEDILSFRTMQMRADSARSRQLVEISNTLSTNLAAVRDSVRDVGMRLTTFQGATRQELFSLGERLIQLDGTRCTARPHLHRLVVPARAHELELTARIGEGSPEAAIALVMSARMIPGFFLASVGGVLVDRLDRKRVMVACDIGRGLVLATLPFVDTVVGLFFGGVLLRVGLGLIVTALLLLFDRTVAEAEGRVRGLGPSQVAGEHDAGALGGEALCDGESDALRASGDHRGAALEQWLCHVSSFAVVVRQILFRLISCAAITLRWISLVPSPTIISGASRK